MKYFFWFLWSPVALAGFLWEFTLDMFARGRAFYRLIEEIEA